MLSDDFRDILSAFTDAGVEYLIVGAYAMAAHGVVRATGDIDLWANPSQENAARVVQALRAFGAPLHDTSVEDFARPDLVFQIGVAPHRIDVLTGIDGVGFDEAWADRSIIRLAGLDVPTLGRALLVVNKRATGRRRDVDDADRLEGLA